MISADYLIIGGGIAGTSAAETIREKDSIASIAIVECEPHCLYSKVLIPHYLKHKISRDKLFLRTIGDYESKKISFYPKATVIGVDTAKNEISVVFGDSDQATHETFAYKKLLIASGGVPHTIPATLDFGNTIEVCRMQTLDDADHIKLAMERARTKDALVLGEGLIAMEFMEVFFANGFRVHSLCRGGIFGEKKFGVHGARMLEDYYARHGIQFYKNIKDEEFAHRETWLTEKTKPIDVSLAGVGIGIKRNIDIFSGVGKNIGIVTSEFLETSNSTVWASGDVAEYFDIRNKKHHVVGNWNSAFVQGRVAALNMLGLKTSFTAAPSYSIVNFDLNITFLGDIYDYDDTMELIGTVVNPFLFRVLFKNDTICGAVLINRFADKTNLVLMIERGAHKNDVEKTFQQKN